MYIYIYTYIYIYVYSRDGYAMSEEARQATMDLEEALKASMAAGHARVVEREDEEAGLGFRV